MTDALLAPDGSTPDRWAYRAFGLEAHTQGTDDNRFTWVGKQGYYDDREEGLYFLVPATTTQPRASSIVTPTASTPATPTSIATRATIPSTSLIPAGVRGSSSTSTRNGRRSSRKPSAEGPAIRCRPVLRDQPP